ncbi:MAG: fatty acid desaturase family protein [Alphaproteobacteria bacterium]
MISQDDININYLASEIEHEVPRTYRDLLRTANLSPEEVRALHRIRDGRAWFDFIAALVTTAAVPVVYLSFPGVLTAAFCVLLTIRNFNCFAQVAHGAGHGKFLSNGRLNDIVGGIAAALLGFALKGHALSHQIHHIRLNTEEDSDRIWGRPEQTTAELFRMWLQDLLMISAIKRLLQYLQSDRKSYSATPWQTFGPGFFLGKLGQLLPVAIVQAAVIAYYWALVGPEFYIYFYVLPILTLYPAQIRLRTSCEHCFEAGYEPRTAEERWVSRSTRANLFERLVIAPLLIPYHFEHHLLPGVPYYNLPMAHELLEQKGLKVPQAPGYFSFIFNRWREEMRLRQGAAAA